MRNIDSSYFSNFFDEWMIIERFTHQITFNDYLKHLGDLNYFYDNFHGSKQLTRSIIRMKQINKEVLIKLLEHKEHYGNFIKFFEDNKDKEIDEEYKRTKNAVFMSIFFFE